MAKLDCALHCIEETNQELHLNDMGEYLKQALYLSDVSTRSKLISLLKKKVEALKHHLPKDIVEYAIHQVNIPFLKL